MTTQQLQEAVKQAIAVATQGKTGDLTTADLGKVQAAVEKKIQAVADAADK
jgi:uncharacterized protein YqeY